jgi:hypothetical protein
VRLSDLLRAQNIKIREISKWGVYLRKQWEENFANNLNQEEKKKIYLSDYLWHLFSYEKKICLQGNEAIQAFNIENKKSCFIFYQRVDDVIIIDKADDLNTNALSDEYDVYVVDKEFTWTFVQTHESDLGPYFYRKNVSL